MQILEIQEKVQKNVFHFDINAFELFASDTHFYWERILFIGCQYLNKPSQGFTYEWDKTFRADFLSEISKKYDKNTAAQI